MPLPFRPTSRVLSAGRSHRFRHHVTAARTAEDCHALVLAAPAHLTLLPFGAGQSLGDSCLNDGGALIVTRGMAKVLHFDHAVVRPGTARASALRAGCGCALMSPPNADIRNACV
jgi:FAD/FMN-containing dehydrogenase